MTFGKLLTSQVVFNTNKIHPDVFNIFNEANSINVFNGKFQISQDSYNNYIKILKYYIKNPVNKSLIKLLVKETNNQGLHIHCPEGATPKDGPSAGCAITCAILSLLTDTKINNGF